MKKGLLKLFFIIFALSLFAFSGYCQTNFVAPATQEQIDDINHLDSILFSAVFEECDTSELRNMLSADLEFYHDKWGQTAQSADQFINAIATGCAGQRTGQNNQARRILNKESVQVFPISNYGLIHRGKHDFYQKIEGEYKFTESSEFTHLWHFDNGSWKLSRILSYDHKPVKS